MRDILWAPTTAQIKETNLYDFLTRVMPQNENSSDPYDELWQWSIDNKAAFWDALWEFSNVVGERGNRTLINEDDIKNAKFYPDAKLNYAENLLQNKGCETAIVFISEDNQKMEWSWDKLRHEVSLMQQALRDAGIGIGDRVAGYVPNTPYSIAAMLAVTSMGAIWSSCSPDFGYNSIMDRFGQIKPKVLFCADHYQYNNKKINCLPIANKLKETIPSISHIIVFPYVDVSDFTVTCENNILSWDEFTAQYSNAPLTFTRINFNDPLFILYSSGTTGLPKCIVHSVGGIIIQHYKEHKLHADIHPNDRFFYYTTCGWMMWNWLVFGLASGATLVLFDGSPFFPDGNRLINIVENEKVTHFGVSAKYIDACAKAKIHPINTHNLSNLRIIFSTGSPLSPDSFDYIYAKWKENICLSSIAGGTDICGCFIGGSPISPVYRGQCQKRLLGMDVQVYNNDGSIDNNGIGELVCQGAHPSQPIGFWHDENGEKYHNAYYAKFKNIWHHGDLIKITPEGGVVFYGRSDAILNPGGVRIGTAEIYRQVERIDAVLEALVIGQNWNNDVRIILFVRLKDNVTLDDTLIEKIKTELRINASPRHVPAKIIQISDIPRTKSGKITELAVRDIIHGQPVKNTGSLLNPESLLLYKNLPQLEI